MIEVYKNGSNKRYCGVIRKQQINYRFNIKNSVNENPFNYLPVISNVINKTVFKSVQMSYKIGILQKFTKFTRKHHLGGGVGGGQVDST